MLAVQSRRMSRILRIYIRVKKWLNVEKLGTFNRGKSLFKCKLFDILKLLCSTGQNFELPYITDGGPRTANPRHQQNASFLAPFPE